MMKVKYSKTIAIVFKNRKFKVGFVMLLAILLMASLEPLINYIRLGDKSPYEYASFDFWLPPSIEHPLGTDWFGRDVLALMLIGLKNSLIIGFLAGLVSLLIGLPIALLAGYKGGLTDAVLSSIIDGILVIPTWLIIMVIVLYMKRVSMFTLALILGLFSWPFLARCVVGQVRSLRNRAYIELAIVSNMGTFEIIFLEILPNILPYILVGFSNSIVGAMMAEAAMGIIGLGSTSLTLGMYIGSAITRGFFFRKIFHLVAFPILLLLLVFISFNLMNIGLDELFNPRLRKITGL